MTASFRTLRTMLCIIAALAAAMLHRPRLLVVDERLWPEVERVRLLCKRELIGFYEGVGFRMVGPSEVEHGADQWYEMSMKAAFARALGGMLDE